MVGGRFEPYLVRQKIFKQDTAMLELVCDFEHEKPTLSHVGLAFYHIASGAALRLLLAEELAGRMTDRVLHPMELDVLDGAVGLLRVLYPATMDDHPSVSRLLSCTDLRKPKRMYCKI